MGSGGLRKRETKWCLISWCQRRSLKKVYCTSRSGTSWKMVRCSSYSAGTPSSWVRPATGRSSWVPSRTSSQSTLVSTSEAADLIGRSKSTYNSWPPCSLSSRCCNSSGKCTTIPGRSKANDELNYCGFYCAWTDLVNQRWMWPWIGKVKLRWEPICFIVSVIEKNYE